jgi:hypothetical protein
MTMWAVQSGWLLFRPLIKEITFIHGFSLALPRDSERILQSLLAEVLCAMNSEGKRDGTQKEN